MKGMNTNMITPAYESFVNDVCYDMAQEGANININATYNKAAKEGTSIIREAKALMEKKQFDEAIAKFKEAKKCFADAANAIKNEKDGPLSATVIGGWASSIVTPYKLFKQMNEMKIFGNNADVTGIGAIAVGRAVASIVSVIASVLPAANAASFVASSFVQGTNIGRRFDNWSHDAERGQKFKWTFNAFKHDLMYACNAYCDACDNMIKACESLK